MMCACLVFCALTAGWLPGDGTFLDDPQKGRAMDFGADMADAAAFEAMCRADVEHTAKVVRRNGLSTLIVDGEATPPILFKGHSAGGKGNVFSGKALYDAGVRLMVANVGFRGSPWFPKSPWTRDSFDAESAVKTIRKAMLTATNALWLVTLRVDPPMDYVYWHPEEAWRSKDGGYVFGNGVHVQGTHQTLDPINTNSPPAKWEWAWTSMCSRRWREEIESNISAVISRLKETGLSKRIVGIHLGGFHDAQFATAVPDFSPSAKAAFAESGEKDYDRFLKLWPQRLIDELAQHVKGCFGKDIVVFRWCMASFGTSWCSSHDIWEFLNSKYIDGLVPQAGYSARNLGEPLGVKIPHSSFHGHGKLLVCEHDLYPWIIRDPHRPPCHDRMVGRAKNPDEWAMVNRKTAGAMVARNMGWWYFDMGGGWYSPDEIKGEIASTIRDVRDLYLGGQAVWRPSAALVIDSEDLLSLQHAEGCEKPTCSLDAFVREIARSGVPFDSYLKKDIDAYPAIAKTYKTLIVFDSKTKLMGTAEIQRRVREAGGYVPVPECTVTVDMNSEFLSVHGLWDREIDFELPFPCRVINLKSRAEEPVHGNKFRIEVKKGETCWFRFLPRILR